MGISEAICRLPIDDAMNLLKFYFDYKEMPDGLVEIQKDGYTSKERKGCEGPRFYFRGNSYRFYCDEVVPILSLITYNQSRNEEPEKIKEKAKKKITDNNEEALEITINALTERITNFRNEFY